MVCGYVCWHAFCWPLLGAPPCRQPSASPASQVTPASRESRLPGSTLIVCLAASEAHPRLDYHKNTETFLQSTPLPNLLLHFFSPVLLPPLCPPLSIIPCWPQLFQHLSHALLPAQPSHSPPSLSLSHLQPIIGLYLRLIGCLNNPQETHNTLMEI